MLWATAWAHALRSPICPRYPAEAPFLDVGDETVVEPGMVFTIEPGVYVAGLGGFRHSDTVVVRADGIDILTDYPSDIESLTLPL